MSGATTHEGGENPPTGLSARPEPRSESDVIARIDELVDEQLDRGVYGSYGYGSKETFEPCPDCGHDFHGLGCLRYTDGLCCDCGHTEKIYVDQVSGTSLSWTHTPVDGTAAIVSAPCGTAIVTAYLRNGALCVLENGVAVDLFDAFTRFRDMMIRVVEILFPGLGEMIHGEDCYTGLQRLLRGRDYDETPGTPPRPAMHDPSPPETQTNQQPGA